MKPEEQVVIDEDPCHNELGKIFDNAMIQEKPSDVLVNFIENYCIEASDEFLPSKYKSDKFIYQPFIEASLTLICSMNSDN